VLAGMIGLGMFDFESKFVHDQAYFSAELTQVHAA
jgi:hypothetical protein